MLSQRNKHNKWHIFRTPFVLIGKSRDSFVIAYDWAGFKKNGAGVTANEYRSCEAVDKLWR